MGIQRLPTDSSTPLARMLRGSEAGPRPTPVVGAPVRRGRALIVEDVESLRQLASIFLNRQGFETVSVDRGEVAIEAARHDIDLVVLDIGLPGMGGLEVCRRLRADPVTADVPIILVTGRKHPEDLRDSIKAGATAVLAKPFSEEDLASALRRLS